MFKKIQEDDTVAKVDLKEPITLKEDNFASLSKTSSKKNEKLEKKILEFFGVLLQLIVFYLPLINIIFRGKTIPGILS